MAADGVVWPGGSPIRRVFAALFAAALLIASAGCAERPKNVLLPVSAGAPGTSKVDLLVVTTRQESTDPGEMFTGERGLKPAFADITVSIPPDNVRKEGEVAWPKRLPADPATDFAVLKANEIDEATARKWFNERVSKTPDHAVLVFIHGFNNRFEDSVFRLAQIVHDSGTTAVPVLVTWPSRGKLTAYGYDRESTNYSRNAIEKLFQALGKNPNVKDVSILAHSMGNMLALEGLRQMAIRNGHLPAKFKNVMLAAPDVDVDVFRSQIADMGNPRPKFTLFVSRDDRALAMSRRVWGNVARLGAIDPDQEPYKSELETNNITVIDLTQIKTADSLHHSKFAESPQIVQLIGARLSEGQKLTDTHVGLGDSIVAATAGVAAAAGTAAGLAIAAPVAVIDQDTREHLGDQLDNLDLPTPQLNGKRQETNCAKGAKTEACRR